MLITGLDVILIVVMLISAILAMVRGFTREVLAIGSWIAAVVATLVFFPQILPMVDAQLDPSWLAMALTAGGIFLLTLIIVSFITVRISDLILDSRIGALDRSLGFVFGLARGLLLVVIAYLFFAWLVPLETQPEWIRDARSRPILQDAGDRLIAMLPEDPERAILDRVRGSLEGMTEGSAGAGEQGEPSYQDGDRQELDALIEGAGENAQ
ncbi:MAG: CvpA family protein [Pseudomonadota bacterium]